MTASAASTSAHAETAIAAFLRGIERRGFVLAQAQSADPVRAQAAVIASKAAFHEHAASLSLQQWPLLFWQLLLAQPALRISIASNARDALSQLGAGQRAALLLKLVADLDHAHGAEVLRVSAAAYRHALRRALETLQAKGVGEVQLQALRDRLQMQVQHAPETVRRVSPMRLASVNDEDPATAPMSDAQAARARRWPMRLSIGLLAVLLATLLLTFFWQPAFLRHGPISANGMQTLSAHAPAETLSATAAVLAGSDFDLLADPQDEHVARDLDLYAWYAANSNAPSAHPTAPAPLPEASGPETSAPETDAPEASGAQ